MTKRRNLIAPAIVLAIVFFGLALLYWVDSASSLPSFIPGHEAGSSHHHIKHGIASFVVGLALLIFAWFQTGPSGGRQPQA
jgi:amino acid permease